MRLTKSLAWQSILAVMVIAAGCAGASVGSSPGTSPGASTGPITSTAPISSSGTGLPGASSSPMATSSPSTMLDTGAVAVISGPSGFDSVLQGECSLTMPPVPADNPDATPTPVVTYVGQQYMGGTFQLTLAEGSTMGTPGASASPMASPAPLTSSSPGVLATPTTSTLAINLNTTLDTVLGAQPTTVPNPNAPSPTPAVGGRELTADDVLPFAVTATNSQLTASVPDLSITEATLVGGAIAPNARSGYIAADPGTGELIYANFVCLSLTIQSAVTEASPSPAASGSPAASLPAASETPVASESPATSASPAASTAP